MKILGWFLVVGIPLILFYIIAWANSKNWISAIINLLICLAIIGVVVGLIFLGFYLIWGG